MTDTSMTKARAAPGAPRREKPDDFREQFTRLGWGVVEHYSTSWKVVSRWLDEEGREQVRAERRAYRQSPGHYHLGKGQRNVATFGQAVA